MNRDSRAVLIVDDEKALAEIVARTLESEGFICVVANDGNEALEIAENQNFDVVLLDISMPGLSGMELIPRFLTDHPESRILMMTGANDTETAVEAINLGAFDYVTKPFSMIDLSARIEEAIEGKHGK